MTLLTINRNLNTKNYKQKSTFVLEVSLVTDGLFQIIRQMLEKPKFPYYCFADYFGRVKITFLIFSTIILCILSVFIRKVFFSCFPFLIIRRDLFFVDSELFYFLLSISWNALHWVDMRNSCIQM